VARDVARDLEVVNQLQDPFIRRSLKTALHLRRYFPIYVFLLVAVIAAALVPSIQDRGHTNKLASGSAAAGVKNGNGAETASTLGGPATAGALGGAGAPAQRVTRSIAQSLQAANQSTGKTRGGVECAPGVRQLPASRYAVPCTEAFKGNNGGATSFGVLPDKIRIVRRGFADNASSDFVNTIVAQAGGAPPEYVRGVRDVFIKYMDTMFEFYGRKIEWVDYESKYGDSTQEALSKGREGACADATYIKDTLKAFAVVAGKNVATVSDVFASCAAERKMMTFGAAPYFPETWYRARHPYAWGGVMECERIEYQITEYIGKRLAHKPAKWAGDPITRATTRKFGTYVPDNDQYQFCANLGKKLLKEKYNQDPGEQFNYALQVERFADQANHAIVQFHARGVTTIVLACDPISTIFLTQAASKQGYFPEWFSIGVALHDVDNVARLFDPTEVNGHLFGPSQLGSTPKLVGPQSEPGVLYRQLTGKNLTEGGVTDGQYWGLLGIYSVIQAAGPLLTPNGIAAGTFNAGPGGAPEFAVGYTSYQDGPDGTLGAHDHTAIDDAREIYWMGTATSPFDGKTGTYFETYGGKRFRNGEWPREDPPIYPN
jgi:hypothetical protein